MSWKKGQSGNPKGRPRSGTGLAEAIRNKVDPEEITDHLIEIMRKAPNDLTKLRAMEMLSERGWKKPASVVEVGPADPYEDLSDDELAQLRADLLARLASASDVPQALLEGGVDDVSRVDGVVEAAATPALGAVSTETRMTRALVGGVQVRRKGQMLDVDSDT